MGSTQRATFPPSWALGSCVFVSPQLHKNPSSKAYSKLLVVKPREKPRENSLDHLKWLGLEGIPSSEGSFVLTCSLAGPALILLCWPCVCNAGDAGLIPGLGRTPGEGNGNPLQYSCLENPMQRSLVGYSPRDRKSRTQLSD